MSVEHSGLIYGLFIGALTSPKFLSFFKTRILVLSDQQIPDKYEKRLYDLSNTKWRVLQVAVIAIKCDLIGECIAIFSPSIYCEIIG